MSACDGSRRPPKTGTDRTLPSGAVWGNCRGCGSIRLVRDGEVKPHVDPDEATNQSFGPERGPQ